MRKFLLNSTLLGLVTVYGAVPALAAMNVSADHGSVWQTKKIGETTQGFLQIHNTSGADDVLTAWSCPVADTTELLGADDKPLQNLTIPAGQTVTLSQAGVHLLLQNLHYTVDFGSVVPCSFTLQNAGEIAIYLNSVPAPAAH
jgi:copper(I)-binding protein